MKITDEMVKAGAKVFCPYLNELPAVATYMERKASSRGYCDQAEVFADARAVLEAALSAAPPDPYRSHVSSQVTPRMTPGLYRVKWMSGGSSLVAIGCSSSGDNWIAPTNWIAPAMVRDIEAEGEWAQVERYEQLDVPAAAPPVEYAGLVERLQAYAKDQGGWHNIDDTCEEAADAITALEARAREAEEWKRIAEKWITENAEPRIRELEAALEPFALRAATVRSDWGDDEYLSVGVMIRDYRRVAAVLRAHTQAASVWFPGAREAGEADAKAAFEAAIRTRTAGKGCVMTIAAENAVLSSLSSGFDTATHWLTRPAQRSVAATRRMLLSLAKRGLVEPRPYTSGRNYHWRITDAGRARLAEIERLDRTAPAQPEGGEDALNS